MRNENECGDDGDGGGGGGGDGDECVHEFLLPRSACAIAASEKSFDTVWLLKIVYEGVADRNILDQYGHCILQGNAYIDGYYLEYEGYAERC